MIVTKLYQQKYNILENCNATASVGLMMKKNNCRINFSKQIILIYTTR